MERLDTSSPAGAAAEPSPPEPPCATTVGPGVWSWRSTASLTPVDSNELLAASDACAEDPDDACADDADATTTTAVRPAIRRQTRSSRTVPDTPPSRRRTTPIEGLRIANVKSRSSLSPQLFAREPLSRARRTYTATVQSVKAEQHRSPELWQRGRTSACTRLAAGMTREAPGVAITQYNGAIKRPSPDRGLATSAGCHLAA